MNANVDNAIVGIKETVGTLKEQVDVMQNQLAVREEKLSQTFYVFNIRDCMEKFTPVLWHEGRRKHPMFICGIDIGDDGEEYCALSTTKDRAQRKSADVGDIWRGWILQMYDKKASRYAPYQY